MVTGYTLSILKSIDLQREALSLPAIPLSHRSYKVCSNLGYKLCSIGEICITWHYIFMAWMSTVELATQVSLLQLMQRNKHYFIQYPAS